MRNYIFLPLSLLAIGFYAYGDYVQDYSKSKGNTFVDNPKQATKRKARPNPTPKDLVNAPSALDQGNNEADLAITRNIRKAIVDSDWFTISAKNVAIITNDGNVTLKGILHSQQEKTAIETIAKSIVGVLSVDNQIIVSK